jgi:hypothetical protein
MAIQDFVTGQVLTSTQMDNLQANDYNQTVSAKVASYVLVAADKGTRVTMSNAAATTITVNTALFAAGDTLFITNIGAGACTITAGTATVSTASSLVLAQYDSGRLYFTSTGVAIWEKFAGAVSAGATFNTGISKVATQETKTANSWGALTTAQAVTVTTGTKALVSVSCDAYISTGPGNKLLGIGAAVSGATTLALDNYTQAVCPALGNAGYTQLLSNTVLLTGLTAGSNTFTLQFRCYDNVGTANFLNRSISVIDMGS